MSITRPAYCTRDDVLDAMDVALTARLRREIDSAVCSGSASVDSLCHRVFYPTLDTRYFRWPSREGGASWRLWLGRHELISLTSLTAGGTAINVNTSVFLEPEDGPPFDAIELNTGTTSSFTVGSTQQRAIAATGTFGYTATTEPAGALAEALDSSETAVDVTDSSAVGPGDLLLVGTEYMLVTGAGQLSTGQTLQTPVTDSSAVTSIAVTTGSAFTEGEIITLDSERMRITDITGNTLTVDRAIRGSVLASHTGSTIYAPRTLTVVRGAVGSTAATHSDASALARHLPPSLAHELALAEALTTITNVAGAYARPAGAGARTQPQPGMGLDDLRERAFAELGRVRSGSV